jgi:uncharacterized Zn finger protein (UPF0148 family)
MKCVRCGNILVEKDGNMVCEKCGFFIVKENGKYAPLVKMNG